MLLSVLLFKVATIYRLTLTPFHVNSSRRGSNVSLKLDCHTTVITGVLLLSNRTLHQRKYFRELGREDVQVKQNALKGVEGKKLR